MSAAPRSSPLALTVLALLHYEPLHPYGVQRLLKDWGKDQVVNVGQPACLYRTMDPPSDTGLTDARETRRNAQYPQRTDYQATNTPSKTTRRRLDEMLSKPKQEFPQLPAALSLLMMLTPKAMSAALTRRAAALDSAPAAHETDLAREAEQWCRPTPLAGPLGDKTAHLIKGFVIHPHVLPALAKTSRVNIQLARPGAVTMRAPTSKTRRSEGTANHTA